MFNLCQKRLLFSCIYVRDKLYYSLPNRFQTINLPLAPAPQALAPKVEHYGYPQSNRKHPEQASTKSVEGGGGLMIKVLALMSLHRHR